MEESEKSIPPESANSGDLPEQKPAADTEPSKTPEENTENETKKEDEQLTQQPEPMEVHHHSQTDHSKKWTHYLFDFLMLFLAVTAGFIVENKREHYVEQKRVKQFSKQLLSDLRFDSVLFENRKRNIQSMQKGFDSLQYLLTAKTNATDKEVLEILLPLAFAFDVPAVTTTYNQMKATGSLRYIENPELVTHLQDYYDILLPRSIKITEASLVYFSEHVNPFYLRHLRIQDFDPFNDSLINKNPLIVNRSSETDQELANIMGGYRALLRIQTITMNEPALKKIQETIPVLRKEYDLE